jgi:hypothetical protein
MHLSLEQYSRRIWEQWSELPKSADCIIDTSGEQLDEVIENTGLMDFWRTIRLRDLH